MRRTKVVVQGVSDAGDGQTHAPRANQRSPFSRAQASHRSKRNSSAVLIATSTARTPAAAGAPAASSATIAKPKTASSNPLRGASQGVAGPRGGEDSPDNDRQGRRRNRQQRPKRRRSPRSRTNSQSWRRPLARHELQPQAPRAQPKQR